MKKMRILLVGAALTLLLAASSAMATTVPPVGYSWVNAPFWTQTDATTPPYSGDSQFEMKVERFGSATKDASFGLFSVADIMNPAAPTLFEIFSRADEVGSPDDKTVSFKQTASGFQVSLDQTNWTPFSRTFGFYFDYVDQNHPNNNDTYYSFFGLDTDQDDVLNVLTARNNNFQVMVYLDTKGMAAPESFQMQVKGNDLTPVPEPGTMMLLGAGFLGLAIYGKRRKNA